MSKLRSSLGPHKYTPIISIRDKLTTNILKKKLTPPVDWRLATARLPGVCLDTALGAAEARPAVKITKVASLLKEDILIGVLKTRLDDCSELSV